jgi:hypothetical protein
MQINKIKLKSCIKKENKIPNKPMGCENIRK